MTAVEIPDHNGFYYIYGHSRYGISKDGIVIDLKRPGKRIKGFTNGAGYACVSLTDDLGHHHSLLLHRLVMLTFKFPEGQQPQHLWVDHIDGNKLHNSVDNLEWVTPQENTARAGQLCLSKKCLPIAVYDTLTGEIVKYPSATEAGKVFNLHKDTILNRVKHPDKDYDGKKFSLVNPESRSHNKNRRMNLGGGVKRTLVKNVFTGEITECKSMQEAAALMHISTKTLNSNPRYMDYLKQPVVPTGFQFKLVDDPNPWRECDFWKEISESTSHSRVVESYDPKSKEIKRYFSLREASRAENVRDAFVILAYIQNVMEDPTGKVWDYYPNVTDSYTSPDSQ